MGKQTDAFALIKSTFEAHENVEAIDLDIHDTNPGRLKVTVVPSKGKSIECSLALELEENIFSVYSGPKQIAKLATQRFTRDDF